MWCHRTADTSPRTIADIIQHALPSCMSVYLSMYQGINTEHTALQSPHNRAWSPVLSVNTKGAPLVSLPPLDPSSQHSRHNTQLCLIASPSTTSTTAWSMPNDSSQQHPPSKLPLVKWAQKARSSSFVVGINRRGWLLCGRPAKMAFDLAKWVHCPEVGALLKATVHHNLVHTGPHLAPLQCRSQHTFMYGLLVKCLQGPTAVSSALSGRFTSSDQPAQILVNRENFLELWETEHGSDLVSTGEFGLNEYVHELVRVHVPAQELDAVLVFTSDDRVTLVQWDGGCFGPVMRGAKVVSESLKTGEGPHEEGEAGIPSIRRVDGTKVSSSSNAEKVLGAASETWRSFVAAEVYHGWIHICTVEWIQGNGWELFVQAFYVGDVSRDVWHESIRTLNMEFSPADIPCGLHLVALSVDESHPERIASLNVYTYKKAMPLTFMMCVRNLCPSTRLLMSSARLQPCQGDSEPIKEGTFAISSIGISLFHYPVDNSLHSMRELCSWSMKGLPVCCEPITNNRLIVGDSLGGITVAQFGSVTTWFTVETQGPSPAPTCFAYIQSSSEELSGLLFTGSRNGSSQVLGVPLEPKLSPGQSGGRNKWCVINPSAIDNLGPLHDMVAVQGLPGIPDNQLLLCCGEYPSGSLKRACYGMGAESVIVNGPCIQEGVRLLSLKARGDGSNPSHLLFSYEAAHRTDVMSITDLHFQPASIPGFDHESSTVLVAVLPGDALLQVTHAEVRVIPVDSLVPIIWRSPGSQVNVALPILQVNCASDSLTLATLHESTLILAMGSTLMNLKVTSVDISIQSQHEMSQQVSAVHIHSNGLGSHSNAFVAVGQWVSNQILLLTLPLFDPICNTELVGYQPRSFGFLDIGSRGMCMIVGTSTGEVGILEVAHNGEGDDLKFKGTRLVEVGRTGVEIGAAGDWEISEDCVVASCDQSCIIRTVSLSATSLLDCVESVRLYLGESCRAFAPIYSDSIPKGIVWVSGNSQLMCGSLSSESKLRWMTAMVGETPKHAAYHAASQCFILLTEKSGDLKSLHLVDPSSLKPLTSMGLDPSHYPCGVLVAALPCSSSLFDDNGNVLDKKTPWKEFVIVWSYVMLDEGSNSGLQSCHGLISILEIMFESTETGVKYSLNLHGSCTLPSAPHSCTVMTPSADNPVGVKVSQGPAQPQNRGDAAHRLVHLKDGGTTELEWEDSWPVVLVGNQTGVTAYQIFVDDHGILGVEVAKNVLDLLPDSAELSLPKELFHVEENCEALNISDMLEWYESSEEGEVMKAAKEALLNAPHQKLVSKVAGTAQAYTKSPVVALAAVEDLIIASEFLGSLTVFKGEFKPKAPKESLPLYTPMIPLSTDRTSTCVQAFVPLSKSNFLASVHPFGLIVLHYDLPMMEEQIEQWREEYIKRYESGRSVTADQRQNWARQYDESESDTDENAPIQSGWNSMENLGSLMFAASCRLPQIVAGFSPGFLGMHAKNVENEKEPVTEATSCKSTTATLPDPPCVVYYTAGGSIGVCRVISQEDAACLSKIQDRLHSIQSNGKLPYVTEHDHRSMFSWSEHSSESVMMCIDGDFVTKGLHEAEVDSESRQLLRKLCNPGR